MEIREIQKKIDDIKAALDTAFEKGQIDFDEITNELDLIKHGLESFDINGAGVRPRLPVCPGPVHTVDYR